MIKNINKDFKNSKNRLILFLGKFHSLTREELEIFLDKFEITYTDTLDANVQMFIEATIMSPLEEEIAYEAFKRGIPSYSTDQFEKLYAQNLNHNSILMSLKLSNNQDRLSRLLHNVHLNDTLFLKLFNMYDWGEEELFGSSENMEISTLFAKRFYKKERFDPASFHSPVSIFEIAIINENAEVLEAMFNLPTLTVKQSRRGERRPENIKEALATNPHINSSTLKKLLRINDSGVDYFLAQNTLIDEKTAITLIDRNNAETKMSLSLNENLTDYVFEELLKDTKLYENLLFAQKINMERFSKIDTLHPNIGANKNLSNEVIEVLIEKKDIKILKNFSANESINQDFLQKIYKLQIEELFSLLATNRHLSQTIIKELYKKNEIEIDKSIAKNPNTPTDILDALYKRDIFEINKSLALNESLSILHLQQLQLDTRLLNNLKENRTFTENILNNLGI